MALIELGKINIKRTVLGVNCPTCGGDLEPVSPNFLSKLFIRVITFNQAKVYRYQCKNCKHYFKMF